MKDIIWSTADREYMQRALLLSLRGRGAVSPNPLVGAVIVKNNTIIAEGYHRGFGLPHAEKEAFASALKRGVSLKGATLYVTLEPCCHSTRTKKTPPCVPDVIASGVKRVIVAMTDPNPEVSGRGIRALKRAGIVVDVGCLEEEAEALNRGYRSCIEKRRPYIALKMATSIDGRIATRAGESKWITSEESRTSVYELRDEYDAILVGRGTVMQDNPHLKGKKTEPLRIILDTQLRSAITAYVYETPKAVVFTTKKASLSKVAAFRRAGIDVVVLPELSMKRVIKELYARGISSLFIEGGSEIFGSAFDHDSVDRIYWYCAPIVIGGKNALSAVNGVGVEHLKNAKKYDWVSCEVIGPDLCITLNRAH